jgi:hypothetical protein
VIVGRKNHLRTVEPTGRAVGHHRAIGYNETECLRPQLDRVDGLRSDVHPLEHAAQVALLAQPSQVVRTQADGPRRLKGEGAIERQREAHSE